MTVKIVRSWQSQDGKFTLGYDISGNILAKCNDCNKTCGHLLSFKNNRKTIDFRCPDCNRKMRITL
jgi:hypothetical protein